MPKKKSKRIKSFAVFIPTVTMNKYYIDAKNEHEAIIKALKGESDCVDTEEIFQDLNIGGEKAYAEEIDSDD